MTEKRLRVGKAGEMAAISHLEKQGYTILETNYRCPLGEIDIIARDRKTTVIVEVRTKTGLKFGRPEESITPKKAYRLRRLALYYLQSVYKREISCRIDLVAVILNENDNSVRTLNHIKGILSG